MGFRSLPSFFALLLTYVLACCSLAQAQAPAAGATNAWGHGRIVERDGHAIFEADGKPFFLYGAAFFYERLPRDRWASSMAELAEMGINTLDLYVPWNWHELSDGDFDFSGRTNPRRDLDDVLRLAAAENFKIVLRPGPVVRNEWRNGGYPAWLLSRPEYGMPLHDLLEGRYPPTATLQNQHSDDAAAQWMRNTTHVTYAKRWLERVLHECEPYADRILAVALDDDQGAYIDNQTYPAPHFAAYLGWLRDVVHGVTGPDELTFINTYQMKVPASSPVWAMGNWYQSDTYAVGTHDESQLAYSFAELATRPHQPLFASEFQAGWLQGAGDAVPRGADPSNTELALSTMIGTGVRGVVNFPAQDTLDPAGWEAPFANFAYAWDAALALDGSQSARFLPTAEFGAFVRAYGPLLAASVPRYDASIVYPGTSVDITSARATTFASIEAATIDAQQACRSAGFACDIVDAGSIPAHASGPSSLYFVPAFDAETLRQIGPRYHDLVVRLSGTAGEALRRISSPADVATAMRGKRAVVENGAETVFSESPSDGVAGFLSVTNYSQSDRTYDRAIVHLSRGREIALPHFVVHAHSAFVSPIDANLARVFAPIAGDRSQDFPPDLRLTFSECMVRRIGGSASPDPTLDIEDFENRSGGCTMNFSLGGRSGSARIGALGHNVVHLSDFRVTRRAVDKSARRTLDPLEPGLTLRPGFTLPAIDTQHVASARAAAYAPVHTADVYRSGEESTVFDSPSTELIVSPNAGARAFYFVSKSDTDNWFTTVGGLRDDVAIEPPLSTTDRIAKYTHDFPAGTFNRPYVLTIRDGSATFAYTFPDALPDGATIEKTVRLAAGVPGFDLDESVRFAALPADSAQRGVSVESFALDPNAIAASAVFAPARAPIVPGTTVTVSSGSAFAIARGSRCMIVAWHAGDIESASLQERADSIVARLTFAPGRTAHAIFRQVACATGDDPLAAVEAEAQRLPQVTPSPARTP